MAKVFVPVIVALVPSDARGLESKRANAYIKATGVPDETS